MVAAFKLLPLSAPFPPHPFTRSKVRQSSLQLPFSTPARLPPSWGCSCRASPAPLPLPELPLLLDAAASPRKARALRRGRMELRRGRIKGAAALLDTPQGCSFRPSVRAIGTFTFMLYLQLFSVGDQHNGVEWLQTQNC